VGVLQVRREPRLGDRDRDALEIGVPELLVGEDVHERVAHELAGAELALGGAFGGGRAGAGHGPQRTRSARRISIAGSNGAVSGSSALTTSTRAYPSSPGSAST